MTGKEIAKYLEYCNNINLTIITTEEYERLKKFERIAKENFNNYRKSLLDNAGKV